MKLSSKVLLFAIGAFVFSSVVITVWHLMQLGPYQEPANAGSVTNILLRFGIRGAIPFTALLTLGYVAYLKVRSRWALAVIFIILLLLLNVLSLMFLWNVSLESLIEDPFSI